MVTLPNDRRASWAMIHEVPRSGLLLPFRLI
jgi:hypothetical protein